MDLDTANRMIDDNAMRNIGRLLLMSAGVGAAGRSLFGLAGIANRNVQRAKDKEEDTHSPAILLPPKQANDNPVMPTWYYPAAAAAMPVGAVGGWMLIHKLLRSYRDKQQKDDMASAKGEFEQALSDERGTKFAQQLHELAEAYAAGELDSKQAALTDSISDTLKTVWPAYLTAAMLAGGVGMVGGARLAGEGAETRKVKEYSEAMRLRRLSRPINLTAAISTEPDETAVNNTAESAKEDRAITQPKGVDQAPEKSAGVNWGRMARRFVPGLLSGVAGAGAATAAVPYLMTHTDAGKSYLGNQVKNLANDPQWIRQQVRTAASSPATQQAVSEELMPMMQRQLADKHPLISSLLL